MSQENQQLIINLEFKPEYSFENFVITPSTEAAFNALLSAVANPGKKYNPVYVYGEMGVGKSHLLKAAGNKAKLDNEASVVTFVDSKSVLAEMDKEGSEFDVVGLVKEFSNTDLLLIDDIDLLLKQSSNDEKIFHLYNHLMQKGKQLVFAGRIPPHLLNLTDKNLKSRLESGLSIKIDTMNDEDKRKVIKKLAKDFELLIPDRVVNFILSAAPRDFKSLLDIVKHLHHTSLESGKKIVLPIAKSVLKLCKNPE